MAAELSTLQTVGGAFCLFFTCAQGPQLGGKSREEPREVSLLCARHGSTCAMCTEAFNPPNNPRYSSSHFAERAAEVQRGQVAGPRSYNQEVAPKPQLCITETQRGNFWTADRATSERTRGLPHSPRLPWPCQQAWKSCLQRNA